MRRAPALVLLAAAAAACGAKEGAPNPGADEAPSGAATPVVTPPAAELPPFWGVADLHVDLPFQVHYKNRPPDLSKPGGEVTATSLREGCVRLMVLSIYIPSHLQLRRHRISELLAIIDTADDIVDVNPGLLSKTGGPVQIIYGIEGAQALAGAEDRVPELVARGVKLFGLVHANHNDIADSATDPHPQRGGLTQEGVELVRAIYRAGGLVDVSHMSDDSFYDLAVVAKQEGNKPLVATHSNARALVDHKRNLTDDQLRTIAASGGLVGLNFHSPFLRGDGGTASVEGVVQHALHMAEVMGGPEHLAIGSDLDGLIRPADGLETHAGIPELVKALRKGGMADADIRGLLGENARFVLFGPESDAATKEPLAAGSCAIRWEIKADEPPAEPAKPAPAEPAPAEPEPAEGKTP